jgi:hypothetical protein
VIPNSVWHESGPLTGFGGKGWTFCWVSSCVCTERKGLLQVAGCPKYPMGLLQDMTKNEGLIWTRAHCPVKPCKKLPLSHTFCYIAATHISLGSIDPPRPLNILEKKHNEHLTARG